LAQYDFRGDTLYSWTVYGLVLERIGVKLGAARGVLEGLRGAGGGSGGA
jgi:hypothetical protein